MQSPALKKAKRAEFAVVAAAQRPAPVTPPTR
jgi:hypothetical protein